MSQNSRFPSLFPNLGALPLDRSLLGGGARRPNSPPNFSGARSPVAQIRRLARQESGQAQQSRSDGAVLGRIFGGATPTAPLTRQRPGSVYSGPRRGSFSSTEGDSSTGGSSNAMSDPSLASQSSPASSALPTYNLDVPKSTPAASVSSRSSLKTLGFLKPFYSASDENISISYKDEFVVINCRDDASKAFCPDTSGSKVYQQFIVTTTRSHEDSIEDSIYTLFPKDKSIRVLNGLFKNHKKAVFACLYARGTNKLEDALSKLDKNVLYNMKK